jgi:hypothetical protein
MSPKAKENNKMNSLPGNFPDKKVNKRDSSRDNKYNVRSLLGLATFPSSSFSADMGSYTQVGSLLGLMTLPLLGLRPPFPEKASGTREKIQEEAQENSSLGESGNGVNGKSSTAIQDAIKDAPILCSYKSENAPSNLQPRLPSRDKMEAKTINPLSSLSQSDKPDPYKMQNKLADNARGCDSLSNNGGKKGLQEGINTGSLSNRSYLIRLDALEHENKTSSQRRSHIERKNIYDNEIEIEKSKNWSKSAADERLSYTARIKPLERIPRILPDDDSSPRFNINLEKSLAGLIHIKGIKQGQQVKIEDMNALANIETSALEPKTHIGESTVPSSLSENLSQWINRAEAVLKELKETLSLLAEKEEAARAQKSPKPEQSEIPQKKLTKEHAITNSSEKEDLIRSYHGNFLLEI